MRSIFLLLITFCSIGLAVTKKPNEPAAPELLVRPVDAPPPAIAAKPTPSEEWAKPARSLDATVVRNPAPVSAMQVSLGPGLVGYTGKYATTAQGGTWGVSLNAGIVAPLEKNSSWFVGADLGADAWDFASVDKSQQFNAVGIQMLPTAYYRFDAIASALYPYLGASIGPNLYIVHSTVVGIAASAYEVNFEMLLRPGVTFQASPDLSLNLEPKFGLLGSSLIFVPMASANLSL